MEYRILLINHDTRGEVLIVERKQKVLWFSFWIRITKPGKYLYTERDAVAFIDQHAGAKGYVIHYCY